MPRMRHSEDIRPLSEFRANTAAFLERAELLEDIRTAEEQLAKGQGIEHEEAKRQVRARSTPGD